MSQSEESKVADRPILKLNVAKAPRDTDGDDDSTAAAQEFELGGEIYQLLLKYDKSVRKNAVKLVATRLGLSIANDAQRPQQFVVPQPQKKAKKPKNPPTDRQKGWKDTPQGSALNAQREETVRQLKSTDPSNVQNIQGLTVKLRGIEAKIRAFKKGNLPQ